MSDFPFFPPTSVVTLPGTNKAAAFTPKTSEVFKEEHNIPPVFISDKMQYIPWGADNQMPYNIIDLIESDETLSTCQMFNAEVCYGSGLVYDTSSATAQTKNEVEDFLADNDLPTYFLGVCQDFKHFGFAVSVIILNEDGTRIVKLARKQACYVRFAPADNHGTIPYILYANLRNTVSPDDIERIERLLSSLEKLRDDALAMLPDAHHRTASAQYNYFAATMFPTLDIVTSLGYSDHIWQRYQDIHTQLLTIEQRLASDFFSHELMTVLRTANILSQWDTSSDSAHYRRIYQRIAAIEFSVLRIGEYPMPSIIDTVNIIRTAKGNLFAEWKNSDTAKLFENHGYKNKKQSSGYFF